MCKHKPGDTNCTVQFPRAYEYDTTQYNSKNNDDYDSLNCEIVEVREVGKHLVLKIRYNSCKNCKAENAVKILVIKNVSLINAIKWRKIDPHYRIGPFAPNEAPAYFARFEPTEQGWEAALICAQAIK